MHKGVLSRPGILTTSAALPSFSSIALRQASTLTCRKRGTAIKAPAGTIPARLLELGVLAGCHGMGMMVLAYPMPGIYVYTGLYIYIYTHIICSQYIHPYCQSHGWSGYGFWSSVRQSCHPPHPVPCRTQEGKSKTHPYIDVPSLKVVLVTLIMRELRSAIRKKKLVSCSSHVDLRSTPSLTIDPSYHFPWSPWSW